MSMPTCVSSGWTGCTCDPQQRPIGKQRMAHKIQFGIDVSFGGQLWQCRLQRRQAVYEYTRSRFVTVVEAEHGQPASKRKGCRGGDCKPAKTP